MHLCCWLGFLMKLLVPLGIAMVILIVFGLPILFITSRKYFEKRRKTSAEAGKISVGFFHPYCNAGGGGERVLWTAIKAMQNRYPGVKIIVYTGDLEACPDDILKRAEQRFNITVPEPVQFVYLHRRKWVEASMYPIFTLIGQSLGSLVLGIEALRQFVPNLYIDTMGYAFTMPLFKYVGGCRVACYVHYPTITSEMLRRVSTRAEAHNNRRTVARSPFLTAGKLLYYKIFAWLYGVMGRCADIVMVNSSWTEEHVNELWQCTLKTHRVYPPCDVDDLKSLALLPDYRHPGRKQPPTDTETEDAVEPAEEPEAPRTKGRVIKIISVGQFRPEKDHPMQLRSMYTLRQIVPEHIWDRLCLVFIGSCRNAEDEARVADMRDLCRHLSLEKNVEFKVNASYEELQKELQEGTVGLHAMWNEHFGIGVVECMAAGLIMVAHCSGGPQMDIIEQAEGSRNGFLATDEGEYAMAIASILAMRPEERDTIRQAARASVDRFSTQEFEAGFLRAVDPFFSKA